MSIKYNEFGEVISVNGLTTGQHLGAPMQDAQAERPEDNEVYATQSNTVTNCENTVEDAQPKPNGGGVTSWNDLTDKPFGTEITEGVITFDGDVTGWEQVDGSATGLDEGAVLIKVSDSYTSKEQLEGATMEYKYLGNDCTEILKDIEESTLPTGEAFISFRPSGLMQDEVVFISIKGDLSAMGIPLGEGTYFVVYGDSSYIKSISSLTGLVETVKTLDEKYIPDSVKGGGFVLRPTEDELSGDFKQITCTTNYDEMAKALEAGIPVYVVLPESFGSSGAGIKEVISLLTWGYVNQDGETGITARFITFSDITNDTIGRIGFPNGTYVPSL